MGGFNSCDISWEALRNNEKVWLEINVLFDIFDKKNVKSCFHSALLPYIGIQSKPFKINKISVDRITQGDRISVDRKTQGDRISVDRITQGDRISVDRITQGDRISVKIG